MSKIHILKKESKGMHKVIQLISNFWYQKKKPFFNESTCSLDEVDEKPNYMKFQNFEILKERLQGKGFNF